MSRRIGFLISHPIQYYAPIFRALAERCDLTVYFAHRQSAEQQARAGFDVAFDWDIDLLSGYRSKFLTNVSRRPSTDHFWGCNSPDVGQEIADGQFDAFVVPGWSLWSYWQAVGACRRVGVPVLVRGDSQLPAQRGRLLRYAKELGFPSLLRRFDGYLYVGQRNREYLSHYHVPPSRLFFSPHCVDNAAFQAGAQAARAQATEEGRGRSQGRKQVLFVGKLIPRKNPLDVLRAAALLQGKGMSLEVAFAGSGELADGLERFARTEGLPARFHGFVNQSRLPGVYAAADVIALPSDGSETWGLVINEAMACGVPAVVSSGVGCGPDLIEPGETGATFRLGDIAGMAAALETVLGFEPSATSKRLAQRMEIYSPESAADGIVGAANSLRAQPLVR
jgi:glycosyltransferase involved in cell wall biosynthesis